MEMVMHFHGQEAGLLHMGERVALWARLQGLTAKQIAMKARLDLRTAKSALEGNCGPRTFDAMSRAYGWDFIEHVMTPAVGADPLTAREQELHARQAQAAALHARLERERAARPAEHHRRLSVVDREGGLRPALVGGEPRAFDQDDDQTA